DRIVMSTPTSALALAEIPTIPTKFVCKTRLQASNLIWFAFGAPSPPFRERRTTMNESGGLERVRSGELLYTDEVGRDACGIGGVAAKDGKPSAEVLRKAVTALRSMEHRGGVCGDAGDGAGITAVVPQPFFK